MTSGDQYSNNGILLSFGYRRRGDYTYNMPKRYHFTFLGSFRLSIGCLPLEVNITGFARGYEPTSELRFDNGILTA